MNIRRKGPFCPKFLIFFFIAGTILQVEITMVIHENMGWKETFWKFAVVIPLRAPQNWEKCVNSRGRSGVKTAKFLKKISFTLLLIYNHCNFHCPPPIIWTKSKRTAVVFVIASLTLNSTSKLDKSDSNRWLINHIWCDLKWVCDCWYINMILWSREWNIE